MEKETQLYFADIITAIIEKEEHGQLCLRTLNKLKEDFNYLGFKGDLR